MSLDQLMFYASQKCGLSIDPDDKDCDAGIARDIRYLLSKGWIEREDWEFVFQGPVVPGADWLLPKIGEVCRGVRWHLTAEGRANWMRAVA